MITRRKFVQTSLAASALALTGCGDEPQKAPDAPPAAAKPAANAELLLSFVGSTVFVQDGDTILGVMPSGKGVYHKKHSLEHAGYIAGPDFSGPPLPSGVTAILGASGTWKTECLVGKTVRVTGRKQNPKAMNKCASLADYTDIAAKWARKKNWNPADKGAVNSIFMLTDGDLVDGKKAMNQTGARAKWRIKGGGPKGLLDVAVLDLKSPDDITISGLDKDITVTTGARLELAVFAGPLSVHPKPYQYKQITHALLLKTIYDVDVTDDELMPTSDDLVDGEEGEEMTNPCPSERAKVRVPPDSEYCPNYGGTP